MKKVLCYFSAAAAIAVLALSCAKESKQNDVTPTGKGIVFQAESSVLQTKTTIENGTGSERIVKWAAGDKVAVWWGSEQSAVGEAAEAGTSTWFEVEAGAAENYYAVYPSSAGVAFEEGVLTTQVPAVQTGAFADANIAVATASAATRKFQFHNATAVVKFEIASADYDKAVFRGAKGEAIAGKLPVSFTESGITPGTATQTATEIEIPLNGAGVYYFAVLPVQLEKGFSVSLYKGETADPAAFASASCDLQAGTLLNLEVLDGKSVSNLFVTPEGAGKKSGKSWENAMGTTELRALLSESASAAVLDGVTVHMAAGEYYLAGEAEGVVNLSFPEAANPVDISFLGGYPADLAGTSLAGRDTTQYRTVLTGKEDARILTVGDKLNVAFDGISFQDARTPDDQSGALFIKGTSTTVSLKSCRFVNNKNTNSGKSGAAVILAGGGLAAEDCYFAGNYARNAGALYISAAGSEPVTLTRCTFDSNSSANTSGALQNAKHTNVTFSHCVFKNNEAKSYGGGAFHTSTGAVTAFEDCDFTGNLASGTGTNGSGGAISIEQTGEVICTRCKFESNSANCGDQSLAGEGKSAVANNVAGGAIILRHAASKITLNDCTFSGNTTPNGCGGAIGSQVAGSTITVNAGTVFSENSAYFHGGAIFAMGNLAVTGSPESKVAFTDNKTLHTKRNYGHGGAVWVGSKTTASFKYVVFSGNEAGQPSSDGYSSGGGIRGSSAKKITVENCEFTNNLGCNGNGFSIYCSEETSEFKDCNFHDNIGKSGPDRDGNISRFYGGAGEMTAGAASFERCTFKDNLARSQSGVIHFNANGTNTPVVDFTDCLFDGNQGLSQTTAGSDAVSNNGGGCFKFVDGMKMTLNRCIFKNNQCNNRGAVFQLGHNDVLFMNQVAFTNNSLTATGNIWGVNIHSGKSVICMNNVTAFNNSAPNAGNHFTFNTDGGWIITNSTFVDNCTTGVVRANNTSGNGARKSVFCNNIIINRKSANNTLVISTSQKSAGYNLFSRGSAPDNFTLDSSDTNSVTSLTSGDYREDGYRGWYLWTNSAYAGADATVVGNAIKSDTESVGSVSSNIGQDFYNWLDGLGALAVDGRGIARTGAWWPGAYQAN